MLRDRGPMDDTHIIDIFEQRFGQLNFHPATTGLFTIVLKEMVGVHVHYSADIYFF